MSANPHRIPLYMLPHSSGISSDRRGAMASGMEPKTSMARAVQESIEQAFGESIKENKSDGGAQQFRMQL